MSIGILTGRDTRHRYFVQALRARFAVSAIGYEDPGYHSAKVDASDLTPGEQRVVKNHFEERARQEQLFFGRDCAWVEDDDSCRVRHLFPGEINTVSTLEFLESAGVNCVLVYGTSLIRSPLIARWPGRMINLHLGLSPYYRGTATNFYPLLNEEPEYVGATIHLIDSGIDSGAILAHARPTITADDRPHTIGCKAIQAGIATLVTVLHRLAQGAVRPVPQWQPAVARLYLRRDYHPRQVVALYRKLDEGLIARYVSRAERVAPLVRLVCLSAAEAPLSEPTAPSGPSGSVAAPAAYGIRETGGEESGIPECL